MFLNKSPLDFLYGERSTGVKSHESSYNSISMVCTQVRLGLGVFCFALRSTAVRDIAAAVTSNFCCCLKCREYTAV